MFQDYDEEIINRKEFEDQKMSYFGYGFRKTARAHVRLIVPGNGKIRVNRRKFGEYFRNYNLRMIALVPL